MQVETFETIESHEAQSPEFADEALQLIESLGLKGQQRLMSKNEDTGLAQRMPYRLLTDDEAFVYGELCPQRQKPEDYSSGAIPIRVMQVYAHAKELGCFKRFEVWSPKDMTVRDPVLIGYANTNPEWAWQEAPHILARWGEVLDSLPTLSEMAAKRYRARIMAALRTALAEVNTAIATVEAVDDPSLPEVAKKHANASFNW